MYQHYKYLRNLYSSNKMSSKLFDDKLTYYNYGGESHSDATKHTTTSSQYSPKAGPAVTRTHRQRKSDYMWQRRNGDEREEEKIMTSTTKQKMLDNNNLGSNCTVTKNDRIRGKIRRPRRTRYMLMGGERMTR